MLTPPAYDAVPKAPARKRAAIGPPALFCSAATSTRGHSFEAALGSQAEAVSRARQAARPWDEFLLLEGETPTEDLVGALRRPRLLYFGTHGFLLPELSACSRPPSRTPVGRRCSDHDCRAQESGPRMHKC